MDQNPQLHNEREQKHYWKVSKNKIMNYINWENLLESNMPQKKLLALISI
jgi:hypothetical protein